MLDDAERLSEVRMSSPLSWAAVEVIGDSDNSSVRASLTGGGECYSEQGLGQTLGTGQVLVAVMPK